MVVGPGEVRAAADAAVAALSAVLEPSSVVGSRAEWAGVVGSLQQVLDVAAAAQNAAIVRLASIEPEWCEDGTVVETHRALGHVALDAPAIVSGVLSVSALHAEGRVEAAVLLAADTTIGPDGADGTDGTGTGSGLGGLHVAMGAGRLDPYRAGVVAAELEAAPPQVRETVVTMLQGHFEVEDGAHLRRRCRRALARISPELLLERAKQARAQCGLRRWVAEPGVDRWEGTFPSEDAARAWAAVDALAHRYVKDGVCSHIEAARGKALTDLVAGQASIDTVLTITVPATGLTPTSLPDEGSGDTGQAAVTERAAVTGPSVVSGQAAAETTPSERDAVAAVAAATAGDPGAVSADTDDLVEVTGPAGNQPVFVSRAWVTAMATPIARSGPRGKAPTSPAPSGSKPGSGSRSQVVEVAPCHPDTGALIDPASRPMAPAQPAAPAHSAAPAQPDGPTDPEGPANPRAGAGPGTAQPPDARPQAPSAAGIDADRVDGASTLHRIAAGFGAGAYRPSARMAKRVKARDRRCRFPGCTVAAVFCDLDHVRPWPGGPTTDTNLICLCRRHHRVKQRPGWTVTLATDGTVTWTDPTGRRRTTAPADALTCTVLGGAATPPASPVSTSITLTALPDGPHSDLEFRLEHLAAATSPTIRSRSGRWHPQSTTWRDDSGTRHSVELTPTADVMLLDSTTTPCRRPRRGRRALPEQPPF